MTGNAARRWLEAAQQEWSCHTRLGGWLHMLPLSLGLLATVVPMMWFLRRSRGRRLVVVDKDDGDPRRR